MSNVRIAQLTLDITESELLVLREALQSHSNELALQIHEHGHDYVTAKTRSDYRRLQNIIEQVGGKPTSYPSGGWSETVFECRCCGSCIGGTNAGVFNTDPRGPWRRIVGIDGPNAICPACVKDPHCLDHLTDIGYEAAIECKSPEI